MSQNQTMSRALLLTSLFVLAISGCQPGHEEIRILRRPKTISSAVSLSPSTSEIIASMSFGIKLVGRTASCNFPPSVGGKDSKIPIVAQVKPDYEKIKSLSPDLVIVDGDLYNDQDKAQIKALGIDVFEFKSKTVADFAREIQAYGSLVAAESEASTYADKVLDEVKASQGDPLNPKPKVAIIMPGKSGEHYIAGTKGFSADCVRSAGGEIVGPESDRYVPIDAEALIKLNPDMIITAGGPDVLINDPRLKNLSAVTSLKVRGISSDLVTRRGFRVDRFIRMSHQALQNMAAGAK